MSVSRAIKRELRVAFSRKSQPLWIRILKWLVAIAVSVYFWSTPFFWWWILGALALGVTVHFIWRWKTKGWTQPWGGWDDVDAAKVEYEET